MFSGVTTQTEHWPEMGQTHWFSLFVNNLGTGIDLLRICSIESDELRYYERPLKIICGLSTNEWTYSPSNAWFVILRHSVSKLLLIPSASWFP